MSRNGATALIAAAGLAMLLQAGTALAEPVAQSGSSVMVKRPALDLTIRGGLRALPVGPETDGLPAGVARTSVDRRLTSDGLVGSAGFLCGMQPGASSQGAVAARGFDPQGRFLGAKLSLGF